MSPRPFLAPALLFAATACARPALTQHRDDDPIWPVDTWDGPHFAELLEVRTEGNRVAFCSGVQGLQLYRSDADGKLDRLDELSFSLGSGSYPRCQHLAWSPDGGSIAVSSHADQIQPTPFLAIADVNGKRLSERHTLTVTEQVEGVAHTGSHVLAAAHSDGLLVYEVRGDGLSRVGQLTGLGNAWAVLADGPLVWVASGDGALHTIDMADPTQPALIASLALPGSPKHLARDGDNLAVALGATGIAVVDLSDPRLPVLAHTADTPGSAVAVDWTEGDVVVADWNALQVFDMRPEGLVSVGHEPLPNRSTGSSRTLGVAAIGQHFFSAGWTEMAAYRYRPGVVGADLAPRQLVVQAPVTAPGDSSSLQISVDSLGLAAVQLSAETKEPFVITSAPSTLEPGASDFISLRFEPTSDKSEKGSVVLTSNDPDQPEISVQILANQPLLGIGQTVPDWSWTGIYGGTLRLQERRGKATLLAYFSTF